MAKLLRSSLPDGFFHVIARSVDGGQLFADDGDRRRFLRLLERCQGSFRWACHAYCLMTTHYHLVLESRRRDLSAGMQYLNGGYAQGFNRRHGRYGALFAERFSSRCIESEDYLFDACAYVVLNPVKAGVCDRVEDWPWSYSRFGVL